MKIGFKMAVHTTVITAFLNLRLFNLLSYFIYSLDKNLMKMLLSSDDGLLYNERGFDI